jgi:diacylglycerol O-acyltransferase / wax synthase
MRRLDGFSAFMVYNDRPLVYQHTLKIAILDWSDDPEGYSYPKLQQQLYNWIDMFPMLKWKLARVPLGLNHPVWVQDLDFDMSYHVRRIACPAPGDKQTFNELVSQKYAQSLDKRRPLWLTWVVEGLADNRVALVALFHHAYADGAGAGMVLQSLLSSANYQPQTSFELGVDPNQVPGKLALLVRGLIDLPLLMIREVPALVQAIRNHHRLTREYTALGKELPPDPHDAPDSPLNTTYSHARTFAHESYDLEIIRRLCSHFGVTVNDLLVAVVSGAVRRYYGDNNFSPDRPLVANIPINIRTEEQRKEVLGNHVSNSYMSLPIHAADPRQRLQLAARSGKAMKEHLAATGGSGFIRAVELMPPFVSELMNWALLRSKGQLKMLGNIAISNVRGPSEQMQLGNAKVVNWLSIGQVMAGLGVNVTAWSYMGQFNICLMAEAKVIPDGAVFISYLTEALNEYEQIMKQQTASPPPPEKGAGEKL